MSNAANVSAAKPKVGGAIYRAPLGTTLPQDASSSLNQAFKSLGYVSEDGLTNSISKESEEIKAWGGDTVSDEQTSFSDSFKFKLIEALNVDVIKTAHGDENVSGSIEEGYAIKVNSSDQPYCAWVVDMVMKNDTLKRIVVPSAKVTEIADIVYKGGEIVGYDMTVKAVPDSDGNTHYEYIEQSDEE